MTRSSNNAGPTSTGSSRALLNCQDRRCAMRRVYRSLKAAETNAMRSDLLAQLPTSDLPIGEVIRNMRLSIKRSQSEYAQLCGVSPRVLADVEAGGSNPTLNTLQALLLPFAC